MWIPAQYNKNRFQAVNSKLNPTYIMQVKNSDIRQCLPGLKISHPQHLLCNACQMMTAGEQLDRK